MSTIWAFEHIEKKHTLYCRKDCMKKFRSSLRKHATNILDFEKKKNIVINKRRIKKLLHLWKKNLTKARSK